MSINRLLVDIQCFVAMDLYALTMYDFYYFIEIEYCVIKNAKKKEKNRRRSFYVIVIADSINRAHHFRFFFASLLFKCTRKRDINLDWMSLECVFTRFVFISSFITHTIRWDTGNLCVYVRADDGLFEFFIAQSRFLPETCSNVLETVECWAAPTTLDLCIRLIVSQKSIYYDCLVLWIEMSMHGEEEKTQKNIYKKVNTCIHKCQLACHRWRRLRSNTRIHCATTQHAHIQCTQRSNWNILHIP